MIHGSDAGAGGLEWPVAVFAHDEARGITACLDSLYAAASGRPLHVFVLENGSRDGTAEVVRAYADRVPSVELVQIPLGDKANAWNVYVHELAPPGELHFFVDGDVRVSAEALPRLADTLAAHPEALAVSGLPATGRNLASARARGLREHDLWGNLYALSGAFVERIRAGKVKLPIGLIGEDGMVGALAKWDLEPRRDWVDARVAVAPEAQFEFDSLSWLSPGDYRLYWRRKQRYSLRRFQFMVLGRRLREGGIEAMPADVRRIEASHAQGLRLQWRGLDTVFDWLVLWRLRRPSAR